MQIRPKLYQFSNVGRLSLRTRWTSLAFESLGNFSSVIVMRFQNGRNICSADDQCSGIARRRRRSETDSNTNPHYKVSLFIQFGLDDNNNSMNCCWLIKCIVKLLHQDFKDRQNREFWGLLTNWRSSTQTVVVYSSGGAGGPGRSFSVNRRVDEITSGPVVANVKSVVRIRWSKLL